MIEVRASTNLELIRELFREYQAGVDAPVCFASFETELAGLPDPYVTILIAEVDGAPAGCVALKSLSADIAEVKRLYVRAAYRRLGLGEHLMNQVVQTAVDLGYRAVRLDTLPFMASAIALYGRLGFVPIGRYNDIPEPGALFFERSLVSD